MVSTETCPQVIPVAKRRGDGPLVAVQEDAGRIARKVVDALGKPLSVGGGTITTSASVGISIFPDDGADCEALMKSADAAMYRVKAANKGGFRFFEGESRRRASVART